MLGAWDYSTAECGRQQLWWQKLLFITIADDEISLILTPGSTNTINDWPKVILVQRKRFVCSHRALYSLLPSCGVATRQGTRPHFFREGNYSSATIFTKIHARKIGLSDRSFVCLLTYLLQHTLSVYSCLHVIYFTLVSVANKLTDLKNSFRW